MLKQLGWEQAHFQRLARETGFLDPELGSISQDYTSSQRKRSSRKASRQQKSSRRSSAKRERSVPSESAGQVCDLHMVVEHSPVGRSHAQLLQIFAQDISTSASERKTCVPLLKPTACKNHTSVYILFLGYITQKFAY